MPDERSPQAVDVSVHKPSLPLITDLRDSDHPCLVLRVGTIHIFFDNVIQMKTWLSCAHAEIDALGDPFSTPTVADSRDAQTVGPIVFDGSGPDVDPIAGDEAETMVTPV